MDAPSSSRHRAEWCRLILLSFLLLFLFTFLSGFAATAVGALLIVPDHYLTIQSAITAAASGDSIMVRAGLYAESLVLSGKDLTIFGESGAESTILSGSSSFRILDIPHGVTVASVLEDLTFRDGRALKGGGLRLSGGASLTVRRCRFVQNLAVGNPVGSAGGAVMVGPLSTLVVDACLFQDNEAYELNLAGDGSGGAIYADPQSELEIRDSEFIHNTTSGFEGGFGGAVNVNGTALIESSRFSRGFGWEGGGIRASEYSEIVVRGCQFDQNDVWTGAGIYCSFASFTIENNTFTDNTAGFGLDAALVAVGSVGSFENNTVAFNISSGIGVGWGANDQVIIHNNIITNNWNVGVLYFPAPAPGIVACNDVWTNNAGNYGGDSPDLTGVDGNISADPMFCDPGARDLRIDSRSPCAPGNSPPGCDLIGAWPVGCGPTSVAGEGRGVPRPRLLVIPNPVRGGAEFVVEPGVDGARLEIYDPNGRLIDLLDARESVHWKPGRSPQPGAYFARLRGAGGTQVVKFLVVR